MLGFACICNSLDQQGKFRSLTVKRASQMQDDKRQQLIKKLTLENLDNTLSILYYCRANDIGLYRISSKLIVLDSHPLNKWQWWSDEDVLHICNKIARIKEVKLSIHPDQFNVINSPDGKVFQNTKTTLESQARLCELLGIKTMCLHVGGVYGDKKRAKERFIKNFYRLPKNVQNLIHLENDDKSYSVTDVLEICQIINRPMILDWHHNKCLPSKWDLNEVIKTWNGRKPKCHLSSGKTNSTDRKHAEYVVVSDYNKCLEDTKGLFDIMLECKQKELALKKLRGY